MAMAGVIAFYCIEFIFYSRTGWQIFYGFRIFRKMSWGGQFFWAFIIRDFMAYWMHRFSHHKYFWRFHIAHHESDYLDAFAAFRVHPVNFILNTSRAPLLLLFGFHFSVLPLLGILQFVHNIFVHANIKIDFGIFNYLVISPHLHRTHHANEKNFYTKNYGVYLSIWDIIFGTFINATGLKFDMGIENHQRQGFVDTNLKPFLPRNYRKPSSQRDPSKDHFSEVG